MQHFPALTEKPGHFPAAPGPPYHDAPGIAAVLVLPLVPDAVKDLHASAPLTSSGNR